jgi:CRP-like cAMP-binding protein
MFSDRLELHTFETGEFLWRKGSIIQGWASILEGLVYASITDGKSDTVPVALHGGNSWFGELSLLTEIPSYTDYVAVCPTEIIMLPRDALLGIMETDPKFVEKMAILVATRAHIQSEKLMLMRLGNVVIQSVMGLYIVAEGFADVPEYASGTKKIETVTIPIAQRSIASIAGVSRGTLSKCLQGLMLAGLVSINYGKITLCNYEVWRKHAQIQRTRLSYHKDSTLEELISGFTDIRYLLENPTQLSQSVLDSRLEVLIDNFNAGQNDESKSHPPTIQNVYGKRLSTA